MSGLEPCGPASTTRTPTPPPHTGDPAPVHSKFPPGREAAHLWWAQPLAPWLAPSSLAPSRSSQRQLTLKARSWRRFGVRGKACFMPWRHQGSTANRALAWVYGQAVKGETQAGPQGAVMSQCIRRTGFTLKDKLLLWYCSRGTSCGILSDQHCSYDPWLNLQLLKPLQCFCELKESPRSRLRCRRSRQEWQSH